MTWRYGRSGAGPMSLTGLKKKPALGIIPIFVLCCQSMGICSNICFSMSAAVLALHSIVGIWLVTNLHPNSNPNPNLVPSYLLSYLD